MKVDVVFKDGRDFGSEVDGYAIGDPPGFIQVVYSDVVKFYPVDLIDHVTVPNLHAKLTEETP
jgi:hypothetical protein